MEEKTVFEVFRQAPFGYAYSKVILNDMRQPEDYIFLDINHAFEEMTGLKREAILGKKVTEVLSNIGLSSFDWMAGKAVLNDEKQEIIKYLEPLERWYKITVYSPEIGHIVTIFQDISKEVAYIKTLKKQRKEIKRLSRDIETIFNSTQDAMFLVKVEGGEFRYLRNNAAYRELTGFSMEELKDKTPIELAGEEIGEVVKANYQRCIEEQRAINYEETLALPGGVKAWLTTLTPVWEEGEIKYIVGSSKDITLQKKAEEKLQKKLKYEKLVSNISRLALQEENPEVFLTKLLRILGEGTGVSRVYLFERNQKRGTMSNTFEWAAPGITPQKEILQELPEAGFAWWVDRLKNRKVINYSDIEDIPDKNAKELLKLQEIKSLLVLPVYVDENYYGFIGFDECLQYREWEEDEVALLIIVTEIISLYLLQKKREDMLWFENQRFKALVDSTEDIIYELDKEQRYTGVYGKWMGKGGVRPIFFLGKTARDIFGPEKATVHEIANKKALEGEHVVYEWDIEVDDEVKYYQTSLSPIINRKGLISGLVGIGREITALINIKQELQRERELLRTTLLSIGDAVVTTDQEGRITSMNKVAEEITGWSLEEAKDKPFSQVFNLINEYTGQAAEDLIDKVLRIGKIVGLANHTVLINREGRQIPIADSAAPIKDGTGQIYGVVMVFRDVTKEKEQQKQILYLSYHDSLTGIYNRRFMEEKIRQADASQEVPLTVIMGDVNGLKLANDVFGHEVGDKLLQKAVEAIMENCRKEDIVGRWGGDEFLILLPRTNAETAENIIAGIKKSCERDVDTVIKLSISLGYAVKEKAEESLRQTIKEAEEWLYRRKLLEGKSYRNTIINTLLDVLFAKSIETEEHADRLQKYCLLIGRKLKLSAKELDDLSLLAVLHDIGKVGISENILLKPGFLTPDEWKEMKKHPEIGYRIARNTPELAGIAEYIFHHHERWDGKGYPVGLKGEEIPLLCRILAVSDAYDAMTTDRCYSKAKIKEDAMAEIKRNAGSQFDPEIVDKFFEIISSEG
ncbi:MAG: PAS domain S-box protein [Firmicutes bacterium]|nr:PAS domain S-box protein [Bacillota bacterium]